MANKGVNKGTAFSHNWVIESYGKIGKDVVIKKNKDGTVSLTRPKQKSKK